MEKWPSCFCCFVGTHKLEHEKETHPESMNMWTRSQYDNKLKKFEFHRQIQPNVQGLATDLVAN